jgi:hypothetical protein
VPREPTAGEASEGCADLTPLGASAKLGLPTPFAWFGLGWEAEEPGLSASAWAAVAVAAAAVAARVAASAVTFRSGEGAVAASSGAGPRGAGTMARVKALARVAGPRERREARTWEVGPVSDGSRSEHDPRVADRTRAACRMTT